MDLRVAARAPDGVIEAVEHDFDEMKRHWVMGVQWHPERPTHEKMGDALSDFLFRAFMQATRASSARTSSIRCAQHQKRGAKFFRFPAFALS